MAEDTDEKTVKYRRRLDRTPEKDFEKLPNEEKKLISAMRGALENCRHKVDELKNDLSDKERTLDDERSRRQQAEERLRRFLVDPYGSPDVNSELRHRLPRAGKSDPVLDRPEFVGSSGESETEEEVVTRARASKDNSKSSLSPRGRRQEKKNVQRVLNFQEPDTSYYNDVDNEADCTSHDIDDHYTPESRRRCRNHQSNSPSQRDEQRNQSASHHRYMPPMTSQLPYPSHYPPHYPSGVMGYPSPFYAPLPITPWSSVSSMGLFASTHSPGQGQGTVSRMPLSQSCPSLSGGKSGDVGDAGASSRDEKTQPSTSADQATTTTHITDPPSASADNAPEATECPAAENLNASNPTPGLYSPSMTSMSSHYRLPSSLAREGGGNCMPGEGLQASFPLIGVPPYSSVSAGGRDPYVDVSARQTVLLQEEIARLKEMNQQLTGRLAQCTEELESVKLQILAETPKDGTLDSEAARKYAELMSEIRAAEKRRQETVEARVSQAEQEKEQLMHDFEQALRRSSPDRGPGRRLSMKDLSSSSETEDSEDDKEDDEENEDFKQHNSSAQLKVNADAGRVSSLKDALKELERRQQRELQIYQEELQVVMEQRDQALEQVRTERQEVQAQQLQIPSQRERILMAKVSALYREKEKAESLAQQLREEHMDHHMFVSLHKALFQDTTLNDNDKTTDNKLKKIIDDNDDDKDLVTKKEDNQLLEQLRRANQDKSLLQRRCEELEEACKREKEGKNRLERLNGVLRRKLMAMSDGHQPQE